MASLGDLVVKIGADTRDLNKQLGKVQRELRGMTSNITDLGQKMTRSVTLPLAALGAAAVKSAADLETLETSFISLTGGAEQAKNMVEQLNTFAAKTPFQLEEIGKAARQLIAAGTGIDEVNTQLQFLGDIAATSGSSIDEIAAIFAKVQAKGKVELENLNQLAERGIPIFTALSEATGLLPSELGAGAVSVEQFNKTLKSFAEQGGFAEGAMARLSQTAAGQFSTALDNLKKAGAELGNVMLPTIKKLITNVTDLTKRFTAMDDSVKQVVVRLGLIASTIGPGLLFLPQIIEQIKLLSVVMAANPILAFAGVVTAIGISLQGMKSDADNATKSIQELRDSFGNLTEESSKEKLEQTKKDLNALLAFRKDHAKRLEIIEQSAGEGRAKRSAAMREYEATLSKAEEAEIALGRAVVMNGGAFERGANMAESIDNAIISLQNQMAALTPKVVDNTEVVQASSEAFSTYSGHINEAAHAITDFSDKAAKARMSMGEFFSMLENVQVQSEKTTQTTNQMGVAMVNAFGNAASSAQSFAGFAIEAIKGVLIAYLAEAKTRVIANSAEAAAGTGPAYPFVMAGMIGAGMALINKIPIPALAEGGLASGPTMAIVGDNRNAAIDPEVISPLSKLKDMMGGSQVEVFGRISGNDIFLSNTRSGFKRNRYS
jgi:tape measure domain-containing protein